MWRIDAAAVEGFQVGEEAADYQPAAEAAETIRQEIFQELEGLNASQLHTVYNYIRGVKDQSLLKSEKIKGYMQARDMLKKYDISLSSDLIREREEQR